MKLLLTGDFNIPTIDWARMSTSSGADQNSELLRYLSFSHNLQQVVLENMRVHNTSASIIHLVSLTEPVFSKTRKISEGISVHKLITFSCDHSPWSFPMPAKTMLPDFSSTSDVDILDYFETNLEPFLSASAESTGIEDLWLLFSIVSLLLCRNHASAFLKRTHG